MQVECFDTVGVGVIALLFRPNISIYWKYYRPGVTGQSDFYPSPVHALDSDRALGLAPSYARYFVFVLQYAPSMQVTQE